MARLPLQPGKPRRSVVGVVLTAEHKAALSEAAQDAGKTVSYYSAEVLSRHLVRTGRIPAPARPPARERETAA